MAGRSETVELIIKARVEGLATIQKLRDVLVELVGQAGNTSSATAVEHKLASSSGLQASDLAETAQNLEKYSDYLQAKAGLDEAYQTLRLEGEKRLVQKESAILQNRLSETERVTGGLSGLFEDLYSLTGRRQKEFFHLAKAAAIAEATMNVYQGVTKALAQGGFYGYAMAAVVASHGAAALGRIFAQSLAEGGVVQGWSPSKTADNIPARLTAGEYVLQVDAVRKYGLGFVEALNRQLIPPDIVAGLRFPSLPVHRPAHAAFASGGMVSGGGGGGGQAREQKIELNNFNILDPKMLDELLASKRGQNAMLNFMSSKAGTVRKVLGLK